MRPRQTKSGTAGGELALLREIRVRAARTESRSSLRLGIGDDCALLGVRPGEELAVTTDLSIAGRHFRMDWHPPESVGHRTLARGLSDLAAMGARPLAAFLSLGVPRELTVARGRRGSWVDRFFAGLLGLADANQTPLAGGDLAESPVALADIVLVGAVPAGRALRRSGARPEDMLYVTGSLGGAAAGFTRLAGAGERFRHLSDPTRIPAALAAHLYPRPRIPQGLALQRRRLASAAIDLSDGLSTDLAHLCDESAAGAIIHSGMLPVAEGASTEQALHGGEDYELLFAAHPSIRIPRSIMGVAITRIGEITRRRTGKPCVMVDSGSGAEPVESRGWQHFSS